MQTVQERIMGIIEGAVEDDGECLCATCGRDAANVLTVRVTRHDWEPLLKLWLDFQHDYLKARVWTWGEADDPSVEDHVVHYDDGEDMRFFIEMLHECISYAASTVGTNERVPRKRRA